MKPAVKKCRNIVSKNNIFGLGPNMCYVNCNLPRTMPMNHYEVKKLIKDGNVKILEEKLLNGEGYKLIGHYSTNPKIKAFLQSVPIYVARIDMLQDSACKGNLRDMQVLLENGSSSRNVYKISPTKLACSKDLNGVTVLHKAVYYDFPDIVEWLVKNYPQTVHIKDKTLRVPLHYICSCAEVSRIWDLMLEAGADPNALDINNKTPSYYLEYSENINLPSHCKNGTSDQEVSIKSSNIRIWIHERNVMQLTKVIWSGLGDKLLTETSKHTTVNKFLKAVPYIMGIIKEIHKAVIDDNLTLLKKLSREPVPTEVLGSKDKNGLTPLHKAVGLGRLSIVDYILSKNSKVVNMRDNEGRTPLHYVFMAPSKNITPIYNRLVKAGANENFIDKNGKTPKSDGAKPSDIPIDLLGVLPKAPRIASEFPASWDWNILYETAEKDKSIDKSKFNNTSDQSLKTPSRLITTNTMKSTAENIGNDENINNTENFIKMDSIDHVENIENVENFNLIDNASSIENNNHIENAYSIEHIDPVDNIDNSENKENNDPENMNKNYISLYTQSDLHDNDDDDIVSKPNSFTLGEVRQALSNGLLDEILPTGGAVYRVDSLKNTDNFENSDNNIKNSSGIQERNHSAQIIVKKGSLDKIADYILDGKHEQLIGIKSDIPAVQDFLDKIPFYANKIDEIHRYCAVGDLDGLTQVLDRRKFCLARESKSGLGLTPLHTAAVYEQLDVFEYLAIRFPETLKLTDFQGWTPMDYVTFMPNKTFLDKLMGSESIFGDIQTDYHTLPKYKNNGVTFEPEKIRKALDYVREGRAAEEEIVDPDMDTDRSTNSSGKLLSTVMSASRFSAEDREYLTKAVGKPLTSGLKELIKRRPSNPTLYLAEHLTNHYDDPQSDQESGVLRSRNRPQSILDDNRPLTIGHPSTPWNVFKNYRPEFQKINRDEFGMSMIHYAASRTHNRNALFQLLQELNANIGLRDENYRTPRDIAVTSNLRENVKTIDKYMVHIIARGEYNKIINLLLEGYNYILNLDSDKDILTLAKSRGHSHTSTILQNIPNFVEKREQLHRAIRFGIQGQVKEILHEQDEQCVMLAMAKNERSRCSLHIAVLSQNEEIVRFLAEHFPLTLEVLDNIERTALHYAMSVDKVEAMSTILIGCGAKRIAKDLKGRQPSYYFMNKFDIRKLLEEEDELRM